MCMKGLVPSRLYSNLSKTHSSLSRLQGSASSSRGNCIQARSLSVWPFATNKSTPVANDTAPSTLTEPITDAKPALEAAISEATSSETDLTSPSTIPIDTLPADLSTPSISSSSAVQESSLPHLHDSWATFQELGLGKTWFTGTFQKVFFQVHELTGLPWWATIGATVIGIRLVLFPFAGRILAQTGKMAHLQPQFSALIERYQAAKKRQDMMGAQMIQKEMLDMKAKTGFNPLVFLKLPLMQAPIFLGVFFALKGMAEAKLPGFLDGGLSWFTNLSVPDPTWALPVMSVAATLTVIQVGPSCIFPYRTIA